MASPSRIILVTGANSGIGYASCKVIASASESSHVIMAGRSEEKIKAALAELHTVDTIKGTLSSILLDVTDQQSINAAVKQVEVQHGRLDVLVNNAGIYITERDLRHQLEVTLNTNVIGPAMVSEGFTSLLKRSNFPYILYVGSGLGSLNLAEDSTHPHYAFTATAYRISKAALDMLAVQDSKELGKQGIKVFVLCPGLVVSNLRGTSEEQRSAQGHAGDPDVSGKLVLSIMEGERDADVGKFVHKNGIYPW